MNIPVIITRAEPGASQTGPRVDALGFKPIVSPALTLQMDPEITLPSVEDFSGVIFTSANGAKFFAELEDDRSLPAWCVGPSTAAAARDVGFTEVHESTGNAVRLAALIASTIAPPEKPMLHIANAAAKGDLQRELKMRRYRVKFVPLYRAGVAPTLDPVIGKMLKDKVKAIVLVHSAKGANAFVTLTEGLPLSSLILVAISTPAAAPLIEAGLSDAHIATAPNERALLDKLKEAAATLSV